MFEFVFMMYMDYMHLRSLCFFRGGGSECAFCFYVSFCSGFVGFPLVLWHAEV